MPKLGDFGSMVGVDNKVASCCESPESEGVPMRIRMEENCNQCFWTKVRGQFKEDFGKHLALFLIEHCLVGSVLEACAV